jgi:hypothetical protein
MEEDPSLRSGQVLGPQRSWAGVRRSLHGVDQISCLGSQEEARSQAPPRWVLWIAALMLRGARGC